jgi:hypothetical protein
MAWRSPTESDLLGSISSAELTAYRAAVVSESQGDPVTAKLSSAVNFVRGYIAAHSANSLGNDGTLPDALIGPAMDYVAVDVIKRIPGRRIDQARDDARKAAIALFEQVAAGKYAVEAPSSTAVPSESMSSPTPQITTPTNYFSREQQEGI